jgi:hypothetical protein
VTTVLVAFTLATAVAAVEGFEITIPITTVVRAPEGSVTELESRSVPEEFVGQSCAVIGESQNQDSVHPNNDLLVVSGGSSATLPDVERESGGRIVGSGRVVLGSEIVVSLVMGSDEVFSAGMVIFVDCSPIETTTTTIPDEVLPTVVTPTTLPPEVLPTEVVAPSTLPFTGAESDDLALIALALTGTGILFLVATRSKRED